MAQKQIQQNDVALFQMNLELKQKENQQNPSTSLNRINNHQTQEEILILYKKRIQTLNEPQIIKINPINSKKDLQNHHLHKIYPSNSPYHQNQSQIAGQHHNDHSNNKNNDQEFDCTVYPKKARRRRLEIPSKRNNKKVDNIIYEDSQEHKDKPQAFQRVQLDQNPSKLKTRLEIQHTQHHFNTKKDQKYNQSQKMSGTYQMSDTERQLQEKQQQKNLQIQQNQISNLSNNSSIEDPNKEQVIYQNDSSSEEQKQILFSSFNQKMQSKKSFTILNDLPKQIIIQTTIDSLVTNPISKGLKINCLFMIQSNFGGLSKKYNIVLQQTGQSILSAKKEHFYLIGSKFIISTNQNFISKRNGNQFWIGTLTSNFLGTDYQLLERKLMNYQHNAKKYYVGHNDDQQFSCSQDVYKEQVVARISFESNLWGFSGMRNMQVRKLDRFKGTKGDGLKVGTLEDIFEHEHVDKIIKIQTTKPSYNKLTKRYTTNKGKQFRVPSGKNIILHWTTPTPNCNKTTRNTSNLINKSKTQKQTRGQQTETKLDNQKTPTITNPTKITSGEPNQKVENQCLLMAKLSETSFLVEVAYPLSLFQAFGACLANNDTKFFVN